MADSLEAVARELAAHGRCPLAQLGRRPVPGEGPAPATLMLVGQAPGAQEDRAGRPFVGRAGRFLDAALRSIGVDRTRVFITSVEKHFPPGNRPPSPREVAACLPFLIRQIAIVDPRIIVLMGRVAERALRGHPVLRGRRIVATAHPAAAMRFPGSRRAFDRGFQLLASLLPSVTQPGHDGS